MGITGAWEETGENTSNSSSHSSPLPLQLMSKAGSANSCLRGGAARITLPFLEHG